MSKLPSLLESDETSGGAKPSRGEEKVGASLSERLRHAASTPAGRIVFALIVLAALAFGGYRILSAVGSGGADWPRIRVMDPETGDLRWQAVRPGETMPYLNPRTGERSMYIVEYCFDNTCGPTGGTPVVLNNYLGIDAPTKCPSCGATVTPHNPRPEAYAATPPADW